MEFDIFVFFTHFMRLTCTNFTPFHCCKESYVRLFSLNNVSDSVREKQFKVNEHSELSDVYFSPEASFSKGFWTFSKRSALTELFTRHSLAVRFRQTRYKNTQDNPLSYEACFTTEMSRETHSSVKQMKCHAQIKSTEAFVRRVMMKSMNSLVRVIRVMMNPMNP